MTSLHLKSYFSYTLKHINTTLPRQMVLSTFDNEKITPLWQALIEHYQQPHRHYHNLTHIQALMNHFKQYQALLTNPLVVTIAIYYHDVIYQTALSMASDSKSNETLSAEFFVNQLSPYCKDEFIAQVVELILMTEKHDLKYNKLNDINDAKLFLDMDLSILGQSPIIYQSYATAIRQEYAHVTEEDYREGRAQVLSHFLQRDRLYYSDIFIDLYETQARENLQTELKQLLLLSKKDK